MSDRRERPGLKQEALWEALQPRLRKEVSCRTAAHEVDDVLQDVAERFFSRAPRLDSETEALAWARVAARRLIIDRHRRAKVELRADLDRISHVAAEGRALDRLELAEARSFMDSEGVTEASLLGEADRRPATAQERMERSRFRRRLAAHLKDKVGWPTVFPWLRWWRPAIAALVAAPVPFLGLLEVERPQPPVPPEVSALVAQRHDSEPATPVELAQTIASQTGASTNPAAEGDAPEPEAPPPIATVPLPWGDAKVREETPPEGHPAPLFCGRGLYPLPDTCVDHPLRDS